jgi:hypothetical protein
VLGRVGHQTRVRSLAWALARTAAARPGYHVAVNLEQVPGVATTRDQPARPARAIRFPRSCITATMPSPRARDRCDARGARVPCDVDGHVDEATALDRQAMVPLPHGDAPDGRDHAAPAARTRLIAATSSMPCQPYSARWD